MSPTVIEKFLRLVAPLIVQSDQKQEIHMPTFAKNQTLRTGQYRTVHVLCERRSISHSFCNSNSPSTKPAHHSKYSDTILL